MRKFSVWRICNVVLLIVAGLLLCAPLRAQTHGDANIVFRWAFIGTNDISDTESIFPIRKDVVLKSGDSIKMMLELQSDCHGYILFLTSEGEILTLFNSSDPQWQGGNTLANRKILIPGGEAWLTLDDETGTEKLFVLASRDRLYDIENLLQKYDGAASEQRIILAEDVIAEIRAHRKDHKRFKAEAERPVQLGGTFRGKGGARKGLPEILESFAHTYYGHDFLAKSYTIDHRE